jgi:hypothetical protein
MPIATPRDLDIFRILASGPMAAPQIRHELTKFHAKDPKKKDDKGDGYARIMTQDALKMRMCRLRKDGYIVSRIYPEKHGKGTFALYALTPRSIEVLVQEHGFNCKHIRATLPSKETVVHELQVVDIVKTIKRDGGKLRYEYDIEDENFLKARAGESGEVRKRLPYPDLHVTLYFKVGRETEVKNFAVELDNATILESRVCDRAHRLYVAKKWITMVICPQRERINKLRTAFGLYIEEQKKKLKHDAEKAEMDKFYWRTFFTTTYDFHDKGFLNTTWMTIEGGTPAIVAPSDFKGNTKAGQ